MTVSVPFQLRRLDRALPAAAVLLPTDSVAELLDVCKSLRHVSVFAIDSGFLLLADELPDTIPGGLKLRRLSENGYLPADAQLAPALSPAEAADLTRQRGLVFLPAGRLLEFDPEAGRRPVDFLQLPPVRRHRWQAFPDVERPADELHGIQLPPVPPDAGDLPEAEGEPIGGEDPRPADSSPASKFVGKINHSLGSALAGLGKLAGSEGLAKLGENLQAKGREMAPRLTEGILGKQEAALQNLLDKFKKGNLDEALRQAIPFSNQPGRGSRVHTGTRLPFNNLLFSLGSLFGGSGGGGGGSNWEGGRPETWQELAEQYRRAAREALDRGDYRRAAVIHGKLLGDLRMAAEVLSQGGLHREAARLFRDKVKDWNRAAIEFEKAGDFDEALSLCLKTADFERAGDIYRRLGDEQLAIAEYHKAAERLATLHKDFVAAGELIFRKTGRADLAGGYYAVGWKQRGNTVRAVPGAIACAHRLLEIYAFARPLDELWNHIREFQEWLGDSDRRTGDVATFFNKLADLGDLPHLREDRPAIRDCALMALGRQLRNHTEYERTPGNVVSTLFGRQKHWRPELVADATYALKSLLKVDTRVRKPRTTVRSQSLLNTGKVMAVAHARDTGKLFLSDGRSLFVYDPVESKLTTLLAEKDTSDDRVIIRLACNRDGSIFAELYEENRLTCLRWWESSNLSYRSLSWTRVDGDEVELLAEIVRVHGWKIIVLDNQYPITYLLPTLTRLDKIGIESDPGPFSQLRFITQSSNGPEPETIRYFADSVQWGAKKKHIGWWAGYLRTNDDRKAVDSHIRLSWQMTNPNEIQIVGLDHQGWLHWSLVGRESDPQPLYHHHHTVTTAGGYRGAAMVRPGRLASVTFSNQVQWWEATEQKMEQRSTPVQLKSAYRCIDCFLSPETEELLVLMGDGEVFHVPLPVG